MKVRRPTPVMAWLLTALLLLAQGLGLAHRIGHAPGMAGVAWAQDHEAGSNECRLIDQLAQADVLCDEPAGCTLLPLAADGVAGPPRAAWSAPAPAAYRARGPPLPG